MPRSPLRNTRRLLMKAGSDAIPKSSRESLDGRDFEGFALWDAAWMTSKLDARPKASLEFRPVESGESRAMKKRSR